MANAEKRLDFSDRIAVFPSKEDMMSKLRDAKVVGVSDHIDRFYERFLGSIENMGKAPAGILLEWDRAARETLGAVPLGVAQAARFSFPKVIKAIAPAHIAEDAIELMGAFFLSLRDADMN